MKTIRIVPYFATALAIFVFTLISQPLYAGRDGVYAGRDGGGGAGSKINGKFYTFAELGVELLEYGGPNVLPHEGLSEAFKLLKDKSYPNGIFPEIKLILNDRIVYRRFKTVDPKKLELVKNEYEKSLKEPLQNFVLYAYTWMDIVEDQKISYTELYPEFFELTPRQQALVLFHEAEVRYTEGKVPIGKILKVDQEILKVIKAREQGDINIDFSFVYKAQNDAYGIDNDDNLKNEVLKQVIKKFGPINLDQFGKGHYPDNFGCVDFDMEKLFSILSEYPHWFTALQGQKLCIDVEVIAYVEESYNFSSMKKIKITAENAFEDSSLANFYIKYDEGFRVGARNRKLRFYPYFETSPNVCEKHGLPTCIGDFHMHWKKSHSTVKK